MSRINLSGSIWFLAATFAMHSFVYAAPTVNQVSGTVGAGKVLVVTGSGFGVKPTAPPLLWDDFEAGTAGALIQNVSARLGRWDAGSGSEVVRYTDSISRTGKQSSKHDFVKYTNASLAKNSSFSTIYLDFWVRPDRVERISRNWKVWRLFGADDQLQMSATFQCTSRFTQIEDQGANWAKTYYAASSYTPGAWHHVQLIYRQSTPGVADGVIRSFINSKEFGADSSAAITRMGNRAFDQLRIGHYWAHDAIPGCDSNPGAMVYVDDVYVDTSWARVELANHSSYAEATRREILIPKVWSEGRLELTVPQTGFAPGEKLYIFVTDSKNVTQSVGSVVGLGADVSEPKPPSSVLIE